jgi:hypothetical protein
MRNCLNAAHQHCVQRCRRLCLPARSSVESQATASAKNALIASHCSSPCTARLPTLLELSLSPILNIAVLLCAAGGCEAVLLGVELRKQTPVLGHLGGKREDIDAAPHITAWRELWEESGKVRLISQLLVCCSVVTQSCGCCERLCMYSTSV